MNRFLTVSEINAECLRVAKEVNAEMRAQPMIRLQVYGTPAPQGSKRHVGGGRMIESSKKVKPWRQDVKAAAEAWLHENGRPVPMDGPLVARMVFTLPKPKSAPKTRRTYADRKPDLSKLLRSTEDALTDAGLIADDARLVEFSRLAKVFPGEDPEALTSPGVVIEIEPMGALSPRPLLEGVPA